MYVIILAVIALIIAWLLQSIFKAIEIKGGYWNRVVGAAIGALLGDLILGNWGWMLWGFNVIAGIIGSFLIGWIYMLIFKKKVENIEVSNESKS
ncbi:MAG: hypothetical protein PHX56_04870 [Atribacterota bacterium]|jgi:uncharacterized membrane protein YeaQ/YmgE (transglycosylase-associated protein family)|nr:hypothetical protein [Atribacterota bacterium]MDD4289373.1 hypothetical protein [Atribacterota bacterium]